MTKWNIIKWLKVAYTLPHHMWQTLHRSYVSTDVRNVTSMITSLSRN